MGDNPNDSLRANDGDRPTAVEARRRAHVSRVALWALPALLLPLVGWLVIDAKTSRPVDRNQGRFTWQTSLEPSLNVALAEGKLLHVHFGHRDLPLSQRMDETLSAAPVQQLAGAHFVNLRLDSRAHAERFRLWIGGSGALASCVLDVREGSAAPDVLAVLPGFADAERYLSFLHAATQSAPRLRELRAKGASSAESLIRLGDIYAAQGSAVRARDTFASVNGPIPAKANALERLSRLDVEAGRTADARRKLEQARALYDSQKRPATERLALTEALLLSSERRVSEATTLLESLAPSLPTGPERDQAWFTLGTLQHEQKRDADALASLERLLTGSRASSWARRADEQIFHIKNPGPSHQH